MAANISIEVSYHIPSVSGVPLMQSRAVNLSGNRTTTREGVKHGRTINQQNKFRAVSQLNERMGYRSFKPECREIDSMIFDLAMGMGA